MDFTPIETQEQFDAAIGERLKRERETIAKKYADYDDLKTKVTDYEKQVGELNNTIRTSSEKYKGYDSQIAELQTKLKGYETSSVKMRIANEKGIPYELADRLSGETEDDIRKDAETLAKFVNQKGGSAPGKKSEPSGDGKGGDSTRAAIQKMLQSMKGE